MTGAAERAELHAAWLLREPVRVTSQHDPNASVLPIGRQPQTYRLSFTTVLAPQAMEKGRRAWTRRHPTSLLYT